MRNDRDAESEIDREESRISLVDPDQDPDQDLRPHSLHRSFANVTWAPLFTPFFSTPHWSLTDPLTHLSCGLKSFPSRLDS